MNLELINRIYYLEKEIERLETLETAVGVVGGGSITLIETQALVGATKPITFSAIPQTYTHLLFIGSVRSAIVNTNDFVQFHFNNIGITNAAFDCTDTRGDVSGLFNTNIPQRMGAGWVPGSTGPAGFFGAFNLWCFWYTKTDRNRTSKSLFGAGISIVNPPGIDATAGSMSSQWKNTAAAVSRVDFETWNNASNFEGGSTITMFGVN